MKKETIVTALMPVEKGGNIPPNASGNECKIKNIYRKRKGKLSQLVIA